MRGCCVNRRVRVAVLGPIPYDCLWHSDAVWAACSAAFISESRRRMRRDIVAGKGDQLYEVKG